MPEWWDDLEVEVIVAIIVFVFGLVAFELWRWIRAIFTRTARFFSARSKLRRLYREVTRTRMSGRWSRAVAPVDRKLQQGIGDSIPILLVANQKGGVGKTTLAANLGAYFALRQNKRVLFVDLDFQGTLSAPLLNIAYQGNIDPDEKPRLVDALLTDFRARRRGEMTPAQALVGQVRQCPPAKIGAKDYPGNLGHSGFLDAGSALGDLEDWLMLKWVAKLDRSDVRFQLARFLHSPEVQSAYDVVILDAPPRNTTAGVNGLCAATHLLIPSRADLFSWNGARRYLEEATVEHGRLAPHLKLVGFVGTMMPNTLPDGVVPEPMKSGIDRLKVEDLSDPKTKVSKPVPSYWPSGSSFEYLGSVRTANAFGEDTGRTISYLTTKLVRDLIDPIGDRLFEVMFSEKGG